MVLGTSKKQTTQARRLIEKFKVKERLKLAPKQLLGVRPLSSKVGHSAVEYLQHI